MYFDTHAHYDDRQFDCDRKALIESLPKAGIELVVNPGSNLASSEKSIALSESFPFIYAAVGVHPHDAAKMDKDTIYRLETLSAHPKVVAIGEIGLDYHYEFSPREIQKKRFCEQLELARSLKKPVIIHEREALRDCLDIIRQFGDLTGVLHCFSGSLETAGSILDLGFYLSFTGVITFKNAKKALEVLSWMPSDRIMIETDAPYLSPHPNRGMRNSSINLPYIAEVVANCRGISPTEAAQLTTENGKRFFGIRD